MVVVQDSFSTHNILLTDSLSYALEVAILATSILILILEAGLYTPGFQVEEHDNNASIFSLLSFSFIQPIIDKVYQTDDIKLSELPEVADKLRCDEVTPILKHYWNYEQSLKSHFLANFGQGSEDKNMQIHRFCLEQCLKHTMATYSSIFC